MNQDNVILSLEGFTNDLLMCGNPDKETTMKQTRLVNIEPLETDPYSELVDITVTSTCGNGKHTLFDKLLDKKIRMTVEIVEN